MTRLYDDALRPLGLRVTQLNILVAVGKMGDAVPTEVGKYLHIDKSTLSRTLARLVENGWLEELESDDGRSHPVRLSRSGRKLVKEAFPLWEEAQKAGHEIVAARKLL